MRDTIFWFMLAIFVAYIATDYYELFHVGKQLTGNQAFAKAIIYVIWFRSLDSMLRK
jgi:hypothetical protein